MYPSQATKARDTRTKPFTILGGSRVGLGIMSKLTKESVYNFYGPFKAASLARSGAQFLAKTSDGDEDALTGALTEFLNLALDDCLKIADAIDVPQVGDACWMTIRAYQSTDEFVQPRWHRDGRMFQCTCKAEVRVPHSKYAISFLGPGTRALAPSAYVNKVMKVDNDWEAREELAEKLSGCEILAVEPGDIIRFSWGEEDSPVHSEPDWSGQDRVFISVLFGTEEELKDMCECRDTEYGKLYFE